MSGQIDTEQIVETYADMVYRLAFARVGDKMMRMMCFKRFSFDILKTSLALPRKNTAAPGSSVSPSIAQKICGKVRGEEKLSSSVRICFSAIRQIRSFLMSF